MRADAVERRVLGPTETVDTEDESDDSDKHTSDKHQHTISLNCSEYKSIDLNTLILYMTFNEFGITFTIKELNMIQNIK